MKKIKYKFINKDLPIGIFDSGVGGLSILQEVQKILPNESFIFYADQKHVPYGEKTKEELEILVSDIINFFLKMNVKMVIIACNTATVYTIDYIRSKFDFPIIGTVPAIKSLAKVTKSGKVGILSTPATSRSLYLDKLIEEFAPKLKVYKVGATHLEDLVEDGNLESKEIENNLKYNIPKLTRQNVDAIAMGCTHYPFLRDKIERIAGAGVKLVDSGEAIAKQTKKVLEDNDMMSESKIHEDYYYTSGDKDKFKKVAEELLGKKLKKVRKVNI